MIDESSGASTPNKQYQLSLRLAARPGFCCCGFLLAPTDAARVRRVLAFVQTFVRSQKAKRAKTLDRDQPKAP